MSWKAENRHNMICRSSWRGFLDFFKIPLIWYQTIANFSLIHIIVVQIVYDVIMSHNLRFKFQPKKQLISHIARPCPSMNLVSFNSIFQGLSNEVCLVSGDERRNNKISWLMFSTLFWGWKFQPSIFSYRFLNSAH